MTKTKKTKAPEIVLPAPKTPADHPVPTPEQLAEAAKFEAKCRKEWKAKEDSFERCDTDGFLSQWASGLTAQEYGRKAEILRHGGCAKFLGLFSIETGERVPAKNIETKFGDRWAVFAEDGQTIVKWLPFAPKRVATLAKHGYFEAEEWAPAYAKCVGTGHGLSGTAWIATLRADGGYPGAAK